MITRREFVAGTAVLAGATALGLAGCGGGATPTGPSPTPSRWIALSTAGLVPGEPRWIEFDTSPVATNPPSLVPGATPADALPKARGGAWLVRDAPGEAAGSVVAFLSFCPHQLCLYDWEISNTRFHCRCHAGFFTADGTVVSGPPPRPLWRYATRSIGPDAIEIGWYDKA